MPPRGGWLRPGDRACRDQVSPRDVAARLPDLLDAYDEPGQSLLQTYWVCELASRDVTVALSGLGGDELFSSYPGHVVANLLSRVDRIPTRLREPALALLARFRAVSAARPPSRRWNPMSEQATA